MTQRTSIAVFSVNIFLLVSIALSTGRSPSPSVEIQRNFVKVNEELYVNKYEVSNTEYNEFLDDLRQQDAELYKICLTDSAKWSLVASYSEPLKEYYHRHPAYKNYPAVNIPYKGAVEYCKWLTARYNADPKRKIKQVQFFLPSEELWMNVANAGKPNKMYPWGNYYMRNKDGQFLCNFKRIGDQLITYDKESKTYKVVDEAGAMFAENALFTVAVNSFQPVAPYGIHNMSGNVAEMVAEEGLAKGGSFNSPGYDVRIQSKQNYTNASPEVGFRVFMKVIGQETKSI